MTKPKAPPKAGGAPSARPRGGQVRGSGRRAPDQPLTPRMLQFCEEFLVDLCATHAYQRAYPDAAEKTAKVNGSRHLADPRIQAEVARLMAERSKRTAVTADRVLQEIAHLAFSDMRKFVAWDASGVTPRDSAGLADDDARCVAEVSQTITQFGGSIRLKLHDKKGALELLGRHLGMWKDKVEISGDASLAALVAAAFTGKAPGADA